MAEKNNTSKSSAPAGSASADAEKSAPGKQREKTRGRKNIFESSSRYFTISCYALGVIIVSIIIYRLIGRSDGSFRLLKSFFSLIGPYFIGFLIAYLINPLVKVLYEKFFVKVIHIKNERGRTAAAIASSYIMLLALFVIILFIVIPQLIKSITELISQLPGFYSQLVRALDRLLEKYPYLDSDSVNNFMNNSLPKLQSSLISNLQNIIPALAGIGVSIVHFIVNFVIALIVSVYLIIDKKRGIALLRRIVYSFLRKDHAKSLVKTLRDCNDICKSFFIGKTIDSLIIGVLCFIIMTILRLPYATLISVIVGITNMIPYFGPYIGAIPGVLILFIDKPSYGLMFLILIVALQSFDGFFLGPKILGDSTGLRPLVILFAITCGGAVAGPLGMFLGVPAFGILAYLLDKLLDSSMKKKNPDMLNEKQRKNN